MTALLGSRRQPIKRANRKRKAAKWERNFGDKRHWIVTLNCEVTGVVEEDGHKIDAAHMKARGMGGCGGDKTTLVPLEHGVHTDFDEMSVAKFKTKYGRTKQSVKDAAPKYEERWQRVQAGAPDLAF